jgi:hypothetical protein
VLRHRLPLDPLQKPAVDTEAERAAIGDCDDAQVLITRSVLTVIDWCAGNSRPSRASDFSLEASARYDESTWGQEEGSSDFGGTAG